MNWVGGARNRIKMKQERKIQKEFFEKKRLARKVRRSKSLSPEEKCNAGVTVSQDLHALKVIMAAHDAPKKKDRTVKKPVLINLDGPKTSLQNFIKGKMDLPMSPCKPSKLQLGEVSPTLQPNSLLEQSQRDLSTLNQTLSHTQTQTCGREQNTCHQKFQNGKSTNKRIKQQSCQSTPNFQSLLRDNRVITNQSLLSKESALMEKRNKNSSHETMPRIKYPLYENELSFTRNNNFQESISLQNERRSEAEEKLKDTIICAESTQCTVRKKERVLKSNDASNSDYVLSKLTEQCSNLKSKDYNDTDNKNHKNNEVLLEENSSLQTQNGFELNDFMEKKPWKVTLNHEKSPFVPYTMPGPLGTFLKKNSKQDCYRDNRCDMLTTSNRDLLSTIGKRENNSRKSFPLYTLTDAVPEKKEMNSPVILNYADDIKKKMSSISGTEGTGSIASRVPENQEVLNTCSQTEDYKDCNSDWRQFVMFSEARNHGSSPKEANPESKASNLVEIEEIKSSVSRSLHNDSFNSDLRYQEGLSHASKRSNQRKGSLDVATQENRATEALEEVMDLEKDLDSYSESSCSSTWSTSPSGSKDFSQDQPKSKETKPLYNNSKENPIHSFGVEIQKTLSFKSLPCGTLTASFTNIGAAKVLCAENWFRVHSGMQNKISALSVDTPPSFTNKTTSNNGSVGREVIRNSDSIQDSKLSTRSGLDDWKSPGARLLYCTETPSALISPATVENAVLDPNQHPCLAVPGQGNVVPNHGSTSADTKLLSKPAVSSSDLINTKKNEYHIRSPSTFEHFARDEKIEPESKSFESSKSDHEEMTASETNSQTRELIAPKNYIKCSIKTHAGPTEPVAQTEQNFSTRKTEVSLNTKLVQTKYATTSPLDSTMITADQSVQMESGNVILPVMADELTTDDTTEAEQVTTLQPDLVIQVPTSQSVSCESNIRSPTETPKFMDTIQDTLTAESSTLSLNTKKRRAEKYSQTEPEALYCSSQCIFQQQTQQLMEQISELRNTCLEQSLIIQAMSGTDAPLEKANNTIRR